MKQTYDIVIVGGGLVGLSVLCALKSTPWRLAWITEVDIINTPSHGAERTTALSLTSRYILEKFSLWSAIAPFAYPLKTIYISRQGEWGLAKLQAKQYQLEEFGYVIDNNYLLEALSHCIEDMAFTTYIGKVKAFSQEKAFATLQGEDFSLSAKLCIAADGAHSSIRQLAGIDVIERPYPHQHALVSHIDVSQASAFTAFERFTRYGPLAFLPVSDQRYSIVWTLSPEQAVYYQSAPLKQVYQALQKSFGGQLGILSNIGQRVIYPLSQLVAQNVTAPHLVLLGNAAQTMHPVAGQGFNLALRDVVSLEYILSHALVNNIALEDESIQKTYQDLREKDREQVAYFTDILARIFTLPTLGLGGLGLSIFNQLPCLKSLAITQGVGKLANNAILTEIKK